jgi:hypothetical protein
MRMSIVQTALVFVGIPAAAVLVIAALVYGRSNDRTPRYRPGGPWQFNPVWYLPHPEQAGPGSGQHAAEPHPHPAALDGARQALPAARVAEPVTASGGASGEW